MLNLRNCHKPSNVSRQFKNPHLKRKFEILNALPTYGEMYISFPENGYKEFSEGLPVKFYKKDNTEWVGNFETGNSNLKFVTELNNIESLLIISYGICYIINSENNKMINKFGYDYKLVFEYNKKFILIGEYSISIVNDFGKIKHFDNLCYDGISEAKLENGKIIATLNDFNSSGNIDLKEFTLDLNNLEVTEKQINIKKKNNNIEKAKNDSKKWWKIW